MEKDLSIEARRFKKVREELHQTQQSLKHSITLDGVKQK